jgi:hypothetical protein
VGTKYKRTDARFGFGFCFSKALLNEINNIGIVCRKEEYQIS